jgi:hypothetical protein
MGGIFISYRRDDSADICGRLYDHLVSRFGTSAVFTDVDSVPYGASYPEYRQQQLASCSVCLVVIGPRWLESSSNQRWLDDPGDMVRVEIETALTRGVGVIPVLVGGAQMPPTAALPKSLARLERLNAARVRDDPDFTADVGRLGEAIARYVPRAASPAAAPRALEAAPATPIRPPGPQLKPASTATRRRISPIFVVVGVLVLAAVICSVVVLPPLLAPKTNNNYDVSGTWHLTETLPGGQSVDHTLVLQETNSYKVTGALSASPNLSMSVTGEVSEPGSVWRFDGQFQDPINATTTCESDFDATLSDSSHMVQGTFTPFTYAGLCTVFGTQFPPGATFTATKTD